LKQFADRTAVVTGGASGLGAAMARLFAAQGMRVVVADIAAEGAASVARSLEPSGAQAVAARADVGDPASLTALAETTAKTFGGCDLLAANVGVQRIARFEAMTRDEFAWLIHTNVVGTADTVRAFLPQLRTSADAHVLMTCSVGSLVATPGLVGYAASKMAVLGLAEGLRAELAPQGIAVTALLPGGMATTHLASSDRARPAHLEAPAPLDPALIGEVAKTLAPTPDAIVDPARAIRNLLAALREERPYLVTHGPIPAAFEERIAAIRAAIARADEECDR
jgi:meso-butanediol dehydrogenase / (S,S)-butanediol dehydrogenase / diacetyl reductase